MKRRVLIVDDDQSAVDLLGRIVASAGYEVVSFTSGLDAIEALEREDFDALVADLHMPGLDGLGLCERALGAQPGIPVIVLTGQATMESAIEALRWGAFDFVTKPIDPELVQLSLARATQNKALRREVERLRKVVDGVNPKNHLLGESPAMRRVQDMIDRIAPSDATVLVHGETGTGKELAARAIHNKSNRAAGPFVAINCAAMPPALLESELFGHAKGAFTDAKGAKAGLFHDANGGTLFLDEIGELPIDLQPKLLRALQERTVRPVGSNTEVPFDARIIAATNRDLEEEVFAKRFREDLYYRINVVQVELPPLRGRGKDVLTIAQAMLARFAGARDLVLTQEAANRLASYEWPGNVRELENCIERAVALATSGKITAEELPDRVRTFKADAVVLAADDARELVTIDELERRYIAKVLKMVNGNKSRAAQLLGLDRRTLYRKLGRDQAAAEAQRPAFPQRKDEGRPTKRPGLPGERSATAP